MGREVLGSCWGTEAPHHPPPARCMCPGGLRVDLTQNTYTIPKKYHISCNASLMRLRGEVHRTWRHTDTHASEKTSLYFYEKVQNSLHLFVKVQTLFFRSCVSPCSWRRTCERKTNTPKGRICAKTQGPRTRGLIDGRHCQERCNHCISTAG